MHSPSGRYVLKAFLDRRVVTMLFLGFAAGLPLLLIFGTLSVWLREAGVSRSTVTYFSWAALGYSFKFVWAPLIDQFPVPVLSRLMGRRRSWLLISQLMIVVAILLMSSIDPSGGELTLAWLALAAVLLGFSSATQDIVIDAFRIESAEADLQALLSSSYIAGYRIAMIVAGAGGLYLADLLGSSQHAYDFTAWSNTYRVMCLAMVLGIGTTLMVAEPKVSSDAGLELKRSSNVHLLVLFVGAVAGFIGCYVVSSQPAAGARQFLNEAMGNKAFSGFLVETARLALAALVAWVISRLLISLGWISSNTVDRAYIRPIRNFFERYGASTAYLLLALIGLYRISDIVLGVISNVFYYDLGFSKTEIANASKVFGLIMTIFGGFLGGGLALKYGVMRILLIGAVLSAATNLLFLLLAKTGYSVPLLYGVIGADNLSAGLASAAFVAFLSALTNIRFTAVQYAIFTSLMTLLPKVIGGYSGSMVDSVGYPGFFLFTALIGLPVILLILVAGSRLELKSDQAEIAPGQAAG